MKSLPGTSTLRRGNLDCLTMRDRYRMEEIRAREADYWSAAIGRFRWYREHFDWFARVRVFFLLALSLLNRWLWGYGERAWILVLNLAAVVFVAFPLGVLRYARWSRKEATRHDHAV